MSCCLTNNYENLFLNFNWICDQNAPLLSASASKVVDPNLLRRTLTIVFFFLFVSFSSWEKYNAMTAADLHDLDDVAVPQSDLDHTEVSEIKSDITRMPYVFLWRRSPLLILFTSLSTITNPLLTYVSTLKYIPLCSKTLYSSSCARISLTF